VGRKHREVGKGAWGGRKEGGMVQRVGCKDADVQRKLSENRKGNPLHFSIFLRNHPCKFDFVAKC